MDVESILNKLSDLKFIRLSKFTGRYQQCYCPFHKGGQEQKPSCGVLLHSEVRGGVLYPEGWWHCFSCGAAYSMPDAITKILETHNISKSGYDWLVENIPGFELDSAVDPLVSDDLLQSLESKFALEYVKSKLEPPRDFVSESELEKYRFTVPYMYDRKLTDDVINKYDIGVDINWIPPGRKKPLPCITFPVRDMEGRTLFVARRAIDTKFFYYPQGVIKPVYGIDCIPDGCKSLIIAESCFNALTAVVYGYPAVALLGTGNSYQIEQLRKLGIPEYVICTDGDDAGRRSALKLKRALSDVAYVWTIPMPDGKDLNDLTKEEFEELYSMRE